MKIYKQIELLVNEVIKNKENNGGFPVAAMFTDPDGRLIGEPIINKRISAISKGERKID